MALRFYVVPAVPFPGKAATTRTPKYFGTNPALSDVSWGGMDYGMQPVYLVAADVTTAQHNLLAAQPDVTAVPENLGQLVGAATAGVKAALESWKIPANWITSDLSYKQILKYVAVFFQISQRLHGMYGIEAYPAGVNLTTTLGSLTQAQLDALTAVADSFGWDVTAATGSWTMQQLFKHMANQWSGKVHLQGLNLNE